MNDLPGPQANKRRMGGPAAQQEEEDVWDTAALLEWYDNDIWFAMAESFLQLGCDFI